MIVGFAKLGGGGGGGIVAGTRAPDAGRAAGVLALCTGGISAAALAHAPKSKAGNKAPRGRAFILIWSLFYPHGASNAPDAFLLLRL